MKRDPHENASTREDKLAKLQEQLASGELVIRQMTGAEQKQWADRDALLTPAQRARREAALEGRRRRDARRGPAAG